ncbi:helix-turn-helix transcriptional regulator [Tenacibaculum agarivorans]|uniref:helix-turn-helix transcriptional regulator n=1 Tax=Tenacibaculum agarivorans TaxID=1908389 RepID=UPI00094B8B27|nr:LuxR C-terminal-related transcriptional regulator [Tenacibaculum agarivorans]
MFQKITSYFISLVDKGVEHVTTEFDRRVIRLLNLISLISIVVVSPVIFIKEFVEENYISLFILPIAILTFIRVIYLNSRGKSQVACLKLLFSITTLAYIPAYIDDNKVEIPFVVLAIGLFSIFLLKNKIWRVLSFSYAFITFSILYHSQFSQREFGMLSFVIILMVLLVFALGLQFVNAMRNKNEITILNQNIQLKEQNEVIQTKSKELLALEKEKHEQELLLKQKDIEMVLTNNQVQTHLNENIINKLKLAKKEGELEKNINQVIFELYQQNEINAKMKLIEQNMNLVNSSFFENLTQAHPNMTRLDKEFCSYIKIGLSSKEIAAIRNTTVNTINVAKTRLRKKLNLNSDISILSYLNSM